MIPTKPPPTLKNLEEWSILFQDFISKCLIKNPEERTSAVELLQVLFCEFYKFKCIFFY